MGRWLWSVLPHQLPSSLPLVPEGEVPLFTRPLPSFELWSCLFGESPPIFLAVLGGAIIAFYPCCNHPVKNEHWKWKEQQT